MLLGCEISSDLNDLKDFCVIKNRRKLQEQGHKIKISKKGHDLIGLGEDIARQLLI